MSNQHTTSRRKFLATAGAAATAGLAGCSSLPFTGPSEFEKELQEVRKVIEPYDGNPDAAIADGYVPFGPFVPGMGWHFFNKELAGKAAEEGFKRTEPQILNYNNEGKIGAVEYGAPAQAVSASPNLFSTENADATEEWELHEGATHVFSNGDDTVQKPKNIPPEQQLNIQNWAEFRPIDEDLSAGDEYEGEWGSNADGIGGIETVTETRLVDFVVNHPDLVSLHVWVGVENPQGIFNPINPEFAKP